MVPSNNRRTPSTTAHAARPKEMGTCPTNGPCTHKSSRVLPRCKRHHAAAQLKHQVRHKRSNQAAPPRMPQPHAPHAGPHPTSCTNVLLFRKHGPTSSAFPPARLVAAASSGSALTKSGSTASRTDADAAPPAAPSHPTPTAPMGGTGGNGRGRRGGVRDPQRQALYNQDGWPQAVNDGIRHGRRRHPTDAPACRAA